MYKSTLGPVEFWYWWR